MGQIARELRSIARDDERACRDERRLLNRLRASLLVTFPAALAIAGEDLGATRILRLLEHWPTAGALAAATREEIIEFGRARRKRPHLGTGRNRIRRPSPDAPGELTQVVREALKHRLASYKIPKRVVLVPRLQDIT